MAKARRAYGVVLNPQSLAIEMATTAELRRQLRAERPAELPVFDFGPAVAREENRLVLQPAGR
jgi:N-methylhydantoinase B